MTLRAKAIRYGYKESAEARTTFTGDYPPQSKHSLTLTDRSGRTRETYR